MRRPDDSGSSLVVHSASSGTLTAEILKPLASWADIAGQEQDGEGDETRLSAEPS